jgi:hypothetical protein
MRRSPGASTDVIMISTANLEPTATEGVYTLKPTPGMGKERTLIRKLCPLRCACVETRRLVYSIWSV